MTEDTVDLPKGLFGYRGEVIEQLVSDRDLMQRQAEGRVRAMEAKVADLERELDETRDELSIRTEQLSELQARFGGAEAAPDETPSPTSFLHEELTSILTAGERAATRIVERAQAHADERLRELEAASARVRREIAAYERWRKEADPSLRSAQARIEGVRTSIGDVPDRVREALSLLDRAVAGMDGDLRMLLELPGPPLAVPSAPKLGQPDIIELSEDAPVVIREKSSSARPAPEGTVARTG